VKLFGVGPFIVILRFTLRLLMTLTVVMDAVAVAKTLVAVGIFVIVGYGVYVLVGSGVFEGTCWRRGGFRCKYRLGDLGGCGVDLLGR
jgi:hypothetical protein